HRDVKKSLDLCCVEVHRHEPVCSRCGNQVGNHLSTDGHTGFVFAVLTCKTEIGNHCRNIMCRCPFGGINHQQQFKKVVAGLVGRLDEEYVTSADRLIVKRLDFAVAEAGNRHFAEVSAVSTCYFFS